MEILGTLLPDLAAASFPSHYPTQAPAGADPAPSTLVL